MRSALVTGGSSGIGLAIARMLREEGFALTLASRTPEKVHAAATELDALGLAADLSREEDDAEVDCYTELEDRECEGDLAHAAAERGHADRAEIEIRRDRQTAGAQ